MSQINNCPVPIYQEEGELVHLVELVAKLQPKRILEVGSLYGGTMWYWMHASNNATIISVDSGVGAPNANVSDIDQTRLTLWPEWERETNCTIVQVRADSTAQDTVEAVNKYAPFDFIFVDGGHDFNTVMADWQNYWPMLKAGGCFAFHDIAYPDNNPIGCGVGIVWRTVRDNGKWQEFVREYNPQQHCGIGVMWKE